MSGTLNMVSAKKDPELDMNKVNPDRNERKPRKTVEDESKNFQKMNKERKMATTSNLKGHTRAEISHAQRNTVHSRLIFHERRQEETEPIEHFVESVCKLATHCEYKENDEMIRDKIVSGIRSRECRDKLLEKGESLTKTTAIEIVTNYEKTKQHLETMTSIRNKNSTTFNVETKARSDILNLVRNSLVDTIMKKWSNFYTNIKYYFFNVISTVNHDHNVEKKDNHFETQVPEEEIKDQENLEKNEDYEANYRAESDEKTKEDIKEGIYSSIEGKHELIETDKTNQNTNLYIFSVDGKQPDTVYATLNVGSNDRIKFKIDTGAQVNVIPTVVYNKLRNPPSLSNTKQRLVSYTGQQLGVKGTASLNCSYKNERVRADFIVADGCQSQPILSLKTSLELKLIQLTLSIEHPNQPLTKERVIKEYEEVFNGFGGLDGYVSIQLKDDAVPVVHSPRRVPYAIKDKVKEELDRMVQLEVIEKVNEPTDWVNSIVVAEKPNGKLRLCLDPKDLNKAIKRPHYSMKTLEEALAEMPNAKYFSKLDAQSGYWQLKLDERSSYLTTFNTPHGRYRFKRLPFGLVCAQDYFQMQMDQIFEGIQGVTPLVDDVLISGSTQEEHDMTLRQALERAKERKLKLNPEKLTVGVQQVDYFGHLVTSEGLKPDPAKVNAIMNMPAPTDKKELSTILGMMTYLSKFSPSLSEATKPMRDVLKDDVEFSWDKPQQDAFEKTKTLISNTPVLAYFDPQKKLVLEVDASKHGLGAAIYNDGKPIAFASKALNNTEQNYAQIEKELYAILFGCTRFHQYVYGRKTEVHSDHKPLESIMKKSLSSAPPRLQRMLLQLQKYDITVKHVSGKKYPCE